MGSLKGERQLQARLSAIGHTDVLLKRAQIRGVANAKRRVHRRTANLARSIRVGSLSKTHASIIAGGTRNVGYAAVEELGHRAYDIRPRRAKVLAWGGQRTLGGRLRTGSKPTHFAHKVHIKEFAGHPYLVPGYREAAEQEIPGAIITVWNGAA